MNASIELAHTLGSGGPDLEMTLVAITMLILGIVFFFNKSVKPQGAVVLVVVGVALGAGAFVLGGDQATSGEAGGEAPDVKVTIAAPAEGSTVPAGPVTLEVEIEGGELVTTTESDDPTEGHLHVFVDGALESMPSNDAPSVTLKPGTHEITVEFTSAAHLSYAPRILDEVSITAE